MRHDVTANSTSAWKQFFFIDCIGAGNDCDADTVQQNHDNRGSNGINSLREVSVDSTSASLNGPFGGSGNNNKTTTKATSLRSNYRRGCIGGSKEDKQAVATANSGGDLDGGSSSIYFDDRKSSKFSLPISNESTNRQKQSRLRTKFSAASLPATKSVRSPSNKALLQSDPLFHLYLICVGLITLSILAIKCLIPGMPIYTHTKIGFAFLLVIIVVSTIYTQVKSRKVSSK